MTSTTTPTPTSRLHAGVIALADWSWRTELDRREGVLEHAAGEVRPEHWTGAEEKLEDVAALEALPVGSIVYTATRAGVILYRCTMSGLLLLVEGNTASRVTGWTSTAATVLERHGSVRLLWAPR
jgi:hypothetical protein